MKGKKNENKTEISWILVFKRILVEEIVCPKNTLFLSESAAPHGTYFEHCFFLLKMLQWKP